MSNDNGTLTNKDDNGVNIGIDAGDENSEFTVFMPFGKPDENGMIDLGDNTVIHKDVLLKAFDGTGNIPISFNIDPASIGVEAIKTASSKKNDISDDPRYDKIKSAIYQLLDAFDVDWDDPNYTKTPHRVAKAYLEYWASGYDKSPEDVITAFPNESNSDDLVIVKDIQFYSMCSHHLAQIQGKAAIAYIPGKKLLGLSKLGRILEVYSRRFQLQERIGAQTADAIMEYVEPKGVMVVLYDVEHGCMTSRGVKLHDSKTTTSAIRGVFLESPALRAEAMNLILK